MKTSDMRNAVPHFPLVGNTLHVLLHAVKKKKNAISKF